MDKDGVKCNSIDFFLFILFRNFLFCRFDDLLTCWNFHYPLLAFAEISCCHSYVRRKICKYSLDILQFYFSTQLFLSSMYMYVDATFDWKLKRGQQSMAIQNYKRFSLWGVKRRNVRGFAATVLSHLNEKKRKLDNGCKLEMRLEVYLSCGHYFYSRFTMSMFSTTVQIVRNCVK